MLPATINIFEKAARKAGKILVRDFGEIENLQIQAKNIGDFVTSADLKVEKSIIETLRYYYPNASFITEESGLISGEEETIVIDPIDGTRSYVIGNPTWSNLISLNYKGYPVLGLANFPKLNKYYLNISKKIAYVFEKGKKRKLRVNKKVLQSQIKVAGAFHGWLS